MQTNVSLKKVYRRKNISQLISLCFLSIFIVSCNGNKIEYDASGTFEATEIIVSSDAYGKIIDFNVQEGLNLKANQVVGAIDSVQLYLKKKQLLATMSAVESRKPNIYLQIASIQQQIETATIEKKRVESLLKANVANQKQLDDINAQIAYLEKQMMAQKSSLNNTTGSIDGESSAIEIQIAQLDDQLQKCKIVSPIDGTVLVKYAEKSELTSQGRPLFKIADTENMFLRAYITSSQLTNLKIGDTVSVYAEFGEKENRRYSGIVTWISTKSEFTPKTIQTKDERANLVYAIKIAVKNDGYLKIGMYGSLLLSTQN